VLPDGKRHQRDERDEHEKILHRSRKLMRGVSAEQTAQFFPPGEGLARKTRVPGGFMSTIFADAIGEGNREIHDLSSSGESLSCELNRRANSP